MPTVSQSVRVLVAACLVAAGMLALTPGGAAALGPPRPLPGYRPAFVTETDTRPWIDCLWASGAMLVDKWTNGEISVTHGRLRRLSGDTHRGSTLANLKVAYAKLGIDLRYSPDGGARITWGGLLNRLAHGGGAVLLGHDSKLPRWYGRWDYRFWNGKAKTDNHAVYIERYDRKHGRVWLMDPLARGDWRGEWISVWALRRFAWTSGGLVYAAVTPKARPAPFAKVEASTVELVSTPTTIEASWSLQAPRHWRYPGADLHAVFKRVDDPLLASVTLPAPRSDIADPMPTNAIGADDAPSTDRPTDAGGSTEGSDETHSTDVAAAKPARPTVAVDGRTLRVTTPLPDSPGAYVARLRLTDRRFGHAVVDTGGVMVYVPGSRRATLGVAVGERTVGAGSMVDVTISVRNSGTDSWAEAVGVGPASKVRPRNTRLVARWIPIADADGNPAADVAEALDPVLISRISLAPARSLVATASIRTPTATGRWAIVIDVVDDIDGSYAALGSRPGVGMLDLVDAPAAFEALGTTTAFTVLAADDPGLAGSD